MLFQSIFTTAVLFVASTIALPTDLESRQSATTCGSTSYTAAQVRSAVSAGYGDYQAGRTYGSNSYPHKYNNYEGFDFPVAGPYEEFPLKTSGVFTGGSPGADRIIFNTKGVWAGTVTHTGASGNDFVGCTGTS
ncbi:guanyl-specific ribonuclease F1 [Aureobasidium pullulans]|nr:guanyl-specific ribonuclease F1 [Aureobasidium pullulans]